MRARSGYASGLQALSLLLATACFGVGRGIAPAPAQVRSLKTLSNKPEMSYLPTDLQKPKSWVSYPFQHCLL